jgi:hypothetical protein
MIGSRWPLGPAKIGKTPGSTTHHLSPLYFGSIRDNNHL